MASVLSTSNAAQAFLPLDQLEANEFALRQVDVEDPNVLLLFDNIAARGVKKPISVRPSFFADKKTQKTTADGRLVYNVVDGLHRYTGACRAKLPEVPVIIQAVSDSQARRDQVMDNLHVIPTKPYEYGQALRVILAEDNTVTLDELANELNVNVEFLERRLGLGGLHKDGVDEKGNPTSTLGTLVDKGDICLGNAVELAKLKPSEEQLAFKKDAVEMPTLQFAKKIKDHIKALREAKQKGKEGPVTVEFSPSAHFRKKQSVEAEIASPNELAALIKAKGITDPIEAAKFALNWALHMDEQSIAVQKAEWDAREKKRSEELAARKKQRAEKALEEANAAEAKAKAAAAQQS